MASQVIEQVHFGKNLSSRRAGTVKRACAIAASAAVIASCSIIEYGTAVRTLEKVNQVKEIVR